MNPSPDAARKAKSYYTRQVCGLCVRCGVRLRTRRRAARTMCAACSRQQAGYRRKWAQSTRGRAHEADRMRRWYRSQRAKGRCTHCTRPAATWPDGRLKSRCEYHAERCRMEERARRARKGG